MATAKPGTTIQTSLRGNDSDFACSPAESLLSSSSFELDNQEPLSDVDRQPEEVTLPHLSGCNLCHITVKRTFVHIEEFDSAASSPRKSHSDPGTA